MACKVIAEIGINHNGDIKLALDMVEAAALCGCDYVKFQKRSPELHVKPELRETMRPVPWGMDTYLNYRLKLEFGQEEYRRIDKRCKELGIGWFASCWDVPSVEFAAMFSPDYIKIASPSLTDMKLLAAVKAAGLPMILSTGMSTMQEIDRAVDALGYKDLTLMHTVSIYPAKNEDLNLKMLRTLRLRYGLPVGYSGHEVGLAPSLAAVAMGAVMVERHFTLDRSMPGSDQAASVEPVGMTRLVRDIWVIEAAMGDGVKRVLPGEQTCLEKLRMAK